MFGRHAYRPAWFGRARLRDDVKGLVDTALRATPEVSRRSLQAQAQHMHPHVAKALRDLGRTDQHSVQITLRRPLETALQERFPPRFQIGDFALGPPEMLRLLSEPHFSYVAPLVERPSFGPPPPPLSSAGLLRHESDAQLVVLTGPAHVVFNTDFKAMPRAEPLVVCSVPGINFAYSSADKQRYCEGSGILHEKAIVRMKVIMAHVFECMKQQGVKIPVLNAIGCGAFKGNYYEVPALWAKAAALVLSEHDYGFDCVIYCLPAFEKANVGDSNFSLFERTFKGLEGAGVALQAPVLMVEDKSMLILADELVRNRGVKAGVLNPSDWEAIRKGFVGMYWDGGHIALEEIMAMQTTLLFQHRGINPGLYQPDRCRPTHLYPRLIHDAQRLDP